MTSEVHSFDAREGDESPEDNAWRGRAHRGHCVAVA